MASDRLRAIWNIQMPDVREFAGLNEFDGKVQDLSPAGVAALLAPIGRGDPEPDAHDEAQLSAVERGARTEFEVVEMHRWNPLVHLANLDLACYDREYAPAEVRAAAKAAHLASNRIMKRLVWLGCSLAIVLPMTIAAQQASKQLA